MPSLRELLVGSNLPPPERRLLRAGSLTLEFEAGDLRYIKLGDREVIRRIYAAVRDHNWGTVPGVISELAVDAAENSFRIGYRSTHRCGEIHFVWRGEVTGADDSTIRFTFDGEAKTTFWRNRIGFCLLHPIRECCGRPCRADYIDGSQRELTFPERVAAEQPVTSLHDLAGLAHEIEPGLWAELRFTGDVFETEDQRNWIDASYKTFCTPLRLPFPVEIKAGTRVQQSIELRLVRRSGPAREELNRVQLVATREAPCQIAIEPKRVTKLPPIGLGAPSHNFIMSERQFKRLGKLKLAHLRVDLRIAEPNWPGALWLAAGSAQADERLELALHFPNVSPMEMKRVAHELAPRREQIVRVVVFQEGTKSTPEKLFKLARKHLSEVLDAPLGVGTNADFYQLNQCRPPWEEADFVCWSMNPQVHAFDDASLMETPEAIVPQIESAREFFPDKPLVVSPITLKPRFNPVATGPEPPVPPGALPPQVDARQMSLFGAAWTLAALKRLAESGADAVTFYETTGWRGVMEIEGGSRLPEKFASVPGAVFPLYHVLADVAEFAGGNAVFSTSSDPLAVTSLVLRRGRRTAMLLANLHDQPQTVRLPFDGDKLRLRRLNKSNALSAMTEPEAFRAQAGDVVAVVEGAVELSLAPYEFVRVDRG